MRLIVFKDNSYVSYKKNLLSGLFLSHHKRTYSNFITKNIIWINAKYSNLNIITIKGYAFDEVLWVGFQDELEVAGKAPVDLLAQLHWPKPKYRFCKPLDKKP